MKTLMIALMSGLLLSVGAWATPEVNRDADYCHIPLSNTDADDEASVGPADCEILVVESGGYADGACACKVQLTDDTDFILDDIEWNKIVEKPEKGTTKYILKTSYKKLKAKCLITAGGGDEYESKKWKSQVTYQEPSQVLKAVLACKDGDPVQ